MIDSPTCRCSHPMDPVFNAAHRALQRLVLPILWQVGRGPVPEKQITWAHWDIVTDADYYPLPVDGAR